MKKAVLSILVILITSESMLSRCQEAENESFLNNLDVDLLSQPTYDQILYKILHPEKENEAEDISREKRQVKEFRQLTLPQIEIPFRDMASIVSEAEAAIINRSS